jgi:hypothetical protein
MRYEFLYKKCTGNRTEKQGGRKKNVRPITAGNISQTAYSIFLKEFVSYNTFQIVCYVIVHYLEVVHDEITFNNFFHASRVCVCFGLFKK